MRRNGDTSFGSDSFLDVLSNLVGIVLILVVLVAARIKDWSGRVALEDLPKPVENPMLAATSPSVSAADNQEETVRQLESARQQWQSYCQRLELAKLHLAAETQSLLAAEHQWRHWQEQSDRTQQQWHRWSASVKELEQQLRELEQSLQRLSEKQAATLPTVSRREVRALHYWLPVSRPVFSHEVYFECYQQRVTPVDLAGLLQEVRQKFPEHLEQLRYRWSVEGQTSQHGAFALKYRIVRNADSPLDWLFREQGPADPRYFSAGLAYWEVVPMQAIRGETLEQALSESSVFRRLLAQVPPETAVLTFFVYPESIPLYRALRDWSYQAGYTVAARPLPVGMPIAGSPSGSRSRAQ
jgi:hypothetical protein